MIIIMTTITINHVSVSFNNAEHCCRRKKKGRLHLKVSFVFMFNILRSSRWGKRYDLVRLDVITR